MYGVATLCDDLEDLVETDLTVLSLTRQSWYQPAVDDAEQQRFENRQVLLIERTVDEDGLIEVVGDLPTYPLGGCGSLP